MGYREKSPESGCRKMNLNQGCGRKITPALTLPRRRRPLPEYYPCCTIVNDDFRDHLWRFNPKSFDLIIADPPYGKNIVGWQKHHNKPDWDDRFPSEDLTALIELPRLGTYYFCEWENLWDYEKRIGDVMSSEELEQSPDFPGVTIDPITNEIRGSVLPKPKSVLIWHKIGFGSGLGDLSRAHARDFEMALFYPGPDLEFKNRPRSVLTCERERSNIHPTQKPVDLLKEIMGWHDFETVLDPFMGSGTTAVAAKELGKHFLGFEANEQYCRRAIQRIAATPAPVSAD